MEANILKNLRYTPSQICTYEIISGEHHARVFDFPRPCYWDTLNMMLINARCLIRVTEPRTHTFNMLPEIRRK